MEINEAKTGDFLILEPVGHLDTRTSTELENKVVEHLGSGQKRFIIDLISTEYISSAGLRVLLMLAKKSDGGERELILCSLNDSVREVFDIAGFNTIFTIVEDRAAAIATGGSRPQADRIFHIAARLMAIKRSAGADEQIDAAAAPVIRRAAELLAIAEERELKAEAAGK